MGGAGFVPGIFCEDCPSAVQMFRPIVYDTSTSQLIKEGSSETRSVVLSFCQMYLMLPTCSLVDWLCSLIVDD